MSKDPAFLFYPGDAANDTQFMNRLERGAYFDLVKSQRLFGGFTAVQLRKILGADFETVWPSLELVLEKDGDLFFVGWLRVSISKRDDYSKKQSERIKKRWNNDGNTTVLPKKENEIENRNEIEKVDEVEIKPKSEKQKSELPTVYLTRKIDVPFGWPDEQFRAAWDEWRMYRKRRHRFVFDSTSTEQSAVKRLADEVHGEDWKWIEDCMKFCMEKGWMSIIPSAYRKHIASISHDKKHNSFSTKATPV
jgi:hypothetical protein